MEVYSVFIHVFVCMCVCWKVSGLLATPLLTSAKQVGRPKKHWAWAAWAAKSFSTWTTISTDQSETLHQGCCVDSTDLRGLSAVARRGGRPLDGECLSRSELSERRLCAKTPVTGAGDAGVTL